MGAAKVFQADIHADIYALIGQLSIKLRAFLSDTPEDAEAPGRFPDRAREDSSAANLYGIPADHGYSDEALQRYRAWIDQAIEHSENRPVIIVDKLARTLELWIDGEKEASFPVDLGRDPISDKFVEGDGATPEGVYRVTWARDRGQTRFYRAYLLDYPNQTDLDELRDLQAKNLAKSTATAGGHIEIHGDGGMGMDWTLGCIALSNEDMDKLFSYSLKAGTPVTIVRYGTRENY
ncbi:L,D-transpeptidase catalytic domain [Thiorhodovibrio winogradskyi]|uniref:L,D-transpeptidase catalytic domain n=2 Tax=Thiorhodovibrio winogradskyi TaxID=77007 RepID=A0ABZ0SFH8_9GAMM